MMKICSTTADLAHPAAQLEEACRPRYSNSTVDLKLVKIANNFKIKSKFRKPFPLFFLRTGTHIMCAKFC